MDSMPEPSSSRTPWYTWPFVGALSCVITLGFLTTRPSGRDLWDFGSFHLSGYTANRGLNPYGTELLSAYASRFHVTLTAPNLNPPVSVPVFRLLAKLDPVPAFRVWWWVSLGLQIACVVWLIRRDPGHKLVHALWGLSLGGLWWMNLALGQIYAPLTLLVVVAYRFIECRPAVAGVCAGVVAAWKPNFLLWPVFLLVAGHTGVAWTALLVFATVSAAPALLLGFDIYREWIAALAAYKGMHVATNVSLTAWLATFLPQLAAWVMAAAAIIGSMAHLAKHRPSATFCSDLALVLAIALSPIAWAGYTLLLLPVFFRRIWSPALMLSAALLAIPANLLWVWSASHPSDIFGPRMLYPLAMLLLAAGVYESEPRPAASAVRHPR